ncbi:MAG: DUF305 domain-containing protein [Acidimicrobiia bacterium]
MASDTTDREHGSQSESGDDSKEMERKMYLRFAAMIVTGMFVMYWVTFVGSYRWSHIQFSQSRVYMALVMGGTMTLVMLGWMLNMYKNTKLNVGIVVVGLLLIGLGTTLDRTQATVGDVEFMQAMIPHHSLAITRAERFNVDDVRVCELAVSISEAQRREIDEMEWLIEDIRENGAASTPEEARERPVPTYQVDAATECDPD